MFEKLAIYTPETKKTVFCWAGDSEYDKYLSDELLLIKLVVFSLL